MTDTARVDPVEVLARVGGALPGIGGSRRAFEVWLDKIHKAGWQITDPHYQEVTGSTACGSVDIEGIRYIVHYAPRVRRDLIDDSDNDLRQRTVLGYAAWGEPDPATPGVD
jgi:hypothetical protein